MSLLFSTLETIASDLTKIQNQNWLLIIIFSNLNKDKVDGCLDRLTVALEKFSVIISDSNLRDTTYLLHRLETIYAKLEHLRTCRSS